MSLHPPYPVISWSYRNALHLNGQRFPNEDLLFAGVDLFYLSTQTMTGSECEEQQINSGVALPFRGKPSTYLSSDQITVQLLPQTPPACCCCDEIKEGLEII